mmetsp:Transcript_35981/g.52831  ORF Transcript_35981/g.52831 Transcript_35981/m.52831 type:complete len:102 (+) Transcript_35981:296-601(+)
MMQKGSDLAVRELKTPKSTEKSKKSNCDPPCEPGYNCKDSTFIPRPTQTPQKLAQSAQTVAQAAQTVAQEVAQAVTAQTVLSVEVSLSMMYLTIALNAAHV